MKAQILAILAGAGIYVALLNVLPSKPESQCVKTCEAKCAARDVRL